MFRQPGRIATIAVLLTVAAVPACAGEREANDLTAPNAVVADAWAQEARERSSSKPLTALIGSYAALQGLDMYSTVIARNKGANEVNPVMQGSYAKGAAVKAALSTITMTTVKIMARKNKKAAIVTMIALNVVNAAVVAKNFNNAKRLQ